jgi:CubicO group peptidase (beta-lactamase class C family)
MRRSESAETHPRIKQRRSASTRLTTDELNQKLNKVDEILSRYLRKGGPGVAVLVLDGDDPILLKGYGNARLTGSSEEINDDTVFDLASLSKQFTALGILMLIDRTTIGNYGRLGFNTRLSRFFPDLPGAREITIRNLLNHSSGLPDYFAIEYQKYYEEMMEVRGNWYATMVGKPSYIRNADIINLISSRKTLDFAPGTNFSYCNTGYVVLAEIIRHVTEKSLRDFLREEIFEPLKMHKTFVYDETVRGFDEHALCYRRVPDMRGHMQHESIKGDTVLNYIHGDGNVHASVGDLVKWLRSWNRLDDHRSGDLITRSTFRQIFSQRLFRSKRSKYRPFHPSTYKYSSGLWFYSYKNNNVTSYALHHGGSWLGFVSYLMRGSVYLEEAGTRSQLSIVVLSNYVVPSKKDGGDHPYEMAKEISEVFWDLPRRYNVLEYI